MDLARRLSHASERRIVCRGEKGADNPVVALDDDRPADRLVLVLPEMPDELRGCDFHHPLPPLSVKYANCAKHSSLDQPGLTGGCWRRRWPANVRSLRHRWKRIGAAPAGWLRADRAGFFGGFGFEQIEIVMPGLLPTRH
jgi:hypothetical protein